MERILRYEKPASKWLEALPIGNGSLGGMVHGGIGEEIISLNEESFWAGYPQNLNRREAYPYLAQVRDFAKAGKYKEAQDIIESHMLSEFNQPYQPLGALKIQFHNQKTAEWYERNLRLGCGVAETRYETDGTQYKREYFCSYPDQVMAVRLYAGKSAKISCEVSLESVCRNICRADDRTLLMDVTAPAKVAIKDVYQFPQDSEVIYDDSKPVIRGQVVLRVSVKSGTIDTAEKSVLIKDADECVFLLAATTTYKEKEMESTNLQRLQEAEEAGYDKLKERHIADVQRIMSRVMLELEPAGENKETEISSEIPRKSAQMTELLFDYGRYLLVSSSRKGTLPANLQGIWNAKSIPPWWSNWTMNINLEMNYWMACRGNMAECMEPLLEFIRKLSEKGRETAKLHYGCRGWVSHHMTDIWMNTSPVGYDGEPMEGSAAWAMWPMSGVWLCLQLWEYYEYTGNREYLEKTAYPVIMGCLEFLTDWLFYREGAYHTVPSTSPENMYLSEGRECAVCTSSAMDMELVREFLESALKAMQIAGADSEQRQKVEKYLEQLAPVKLGKDGEIMEWGMQVPETEPGHRHFSHLFSLYPGHQFMKPQNSVLKNAAEISLKRRMENGGGATGWSRVWAICLWARLGRGDKALDSIEKFQQDGVFTNLFGYHPPDYFQIDCNLGFPAAIMEMLLQEENGVLYPLPALPKKWTSGNISGLVCRGGYTIDLKWKKNRISDIRIYAKHTGTVKIKLPGNVKPEKCTGCRGIVKSGILELECVKGKTCDIHFTRKVRNI